MSIKHMINVDTCMHKVIGDFVIHKIVLHNLGLYNACSVEFSWFFCNVVLNIDIHTQ